jgi:hypothetical protein
MGISPPDPDDSLSLRGYMAWIRNAWLCKCVCMSSMLWNNTVLRLMFNIAIRRYHPHTGEYNFNNTITYRPDQLNIIYINASEVQQHKLLSTPTVQEDRPFETIEKEQGVIWEIGKVLSVSLFLCVSTANFDPVSRIVITSVPSCLTRPVPLCCLPQPADRLEVHAGRGRADQGLPRRLQRGGAAGVAALL